MADKTTKTTEDKLSPEARGIVMENVIGSKEKLALIESILNKLGQESNEIEKLQERVRSLREQLKQAEDNPEVTAEMARVLQRYQETQGIMRDIQNMKLELTVGIAGATEDGIDKEPDYEELTTLRQITSDIRQLHTATADLLGEVRSEALDEEWLALEKEVKQAEEVEDSNRVFTGEDMRQLEAVEKKLHEFADRLLEMKKNNDRITDYEETLVALDKNLNAAAVPEFRDRQHKLADRLAEVKRLVPEKSAMETMNDLFLVAQEIGMLSDDIIRELEKNDAAPKTPVVAETLEPAGKNAVTKELRARYNLLPWKYSRKLKNYFIQDLAENRAYEVLHIDSDGNIEVGVKDTDGFWIHVPVAPTDTIEDLRERIQRVDETEVELDVEGMAPEAAADELESGAAMLESGQEGNDTDDTDAEVPLSSYDDVHTQFAGAVTPPPVPEATPTEVESGEFVADAGEKLKEIDIARARVAGLQDLVPEELPLAADEDIVEVKSTGDVLAERMQPPLKDIEEFLGSETLAQIYFLILQEVKAQKDGRTSVEINVRILVKTMLDGGRRDKKNDLIAYIKSTGFSSFDDLENAWATQGADLLCDILEHEIAKDPRPLSGTNAAEYMAAYIAEVWRANEYKDITDHERRMLLVNAYASKDLFENAGNRMDALEAQAAKKGPVSAEDLLRMSRELSRRGACYFIAESELRNAIRADHAVPLLFADAVELARLRQVEDKTEKAFFEAADNYEKELENERQKHEEGKTEDVAVAVEQENTLKKPLFSRRSKRLAAAALVATSVSLAALSGRVEDWQPKWNEVEKQSKDAWKKLQKMGRWAKTRVFGAWDEEAIREEQMNNEEPEEDEAPAASPPPEKGENIIDTITVERKEYAIIYGEWKKNIDTVRAIGFEAQTIKRELLGKVQDFWLKQQKRAALVLPESLDTSGLSRPQIVAKTAPYFMEFCLDALRKEGTLTEDEQVLLADAKVVMSTGGAVKVRVENADYFVKLPERFGTNDLGQLMLQSPGKEPQPVVLELAGNTLIFYPGEPVIDVYNNGQPRPLVRKKGAEALLQIDLDKAS